MIKALKTLPVFIRLLQISVTVGNQVVNMQIQFSLFTCPSMAYYDCPWSLYVNMRFLEFFIIRVIEFVGFVGDIVISGVQAKWCTYFLWTLGKFHQWVGKWLKQIETPIIWTIANLRDCYSCNIRKKKEQEKSLFMTQWVRLLSAKKCH